MPDFAPEPKLILPFLRSFYAAVAPLSWPLIRCTAGLMLAVHGWPKVVRLVDAIGGGSPPRSGITQFVILLIAEFVGGICISLGLFTRFFAPAAAIELAVITFGVYWPIFAWTQRGYEYPLFWGLILFAISLRGGGPYSLDRRIGREL